MERREYRKVFMNLKKDLMKEIHHEYSFVRQTMTN